MSASKVSCPKCGSDQLTTHKKGFSGKKAVIGGLLAGPLGLAAGTLGKNKVIITCINCGNQWAAGSHNESSQPTNTPDPNTQFISAMERGKYDLAAKHFEKINGRPPLSRDELDNQYNDTVKLSKTTQTILIILVVLLILYFVA